MMTGMPLDTLKAKYQSVISMIEQNGHLENVNMDGDKLYMKAEVNNENVKNQIWNAIKQVDANYSDLKADINVNSSVPAPAAAAGAASGGSSAGGQTYTVQSGDTLSAIAEQFYGKASAYQKIYEANKDKMDSPDHVRAGTELVIPA